MYLIAWILGIVDVFNICFPGGEGAQQEDQGPRRGRLHQHLQGHPRQQQNPAPTAARRQPHLGQRHTVSTQASASSTTHSLRSLKVTSSTQGSSTAARDATTHSLYRPGRPNPTRTNSYRSTIVSGQGQPLQAREALTTARDAYQHSSYRLGTQLPL